jgi:hypothetical protein
VVEAVEAFEAWGVCFSIEAGEPGAPMGREAAARGRKSRIYAATAAAATEAVTNARGIRIPHFIAQIGGG